MSLTPIFVASAGRTGTTAVMARLGTDPRVAFDRVYPFEYRYLTYLAKFAVLAAGAGSGPHLDQTSLYDHNDPHLGLLPWPVQQGTASLAVPTPDWLTALWKAFSAAARERQPAASHYAEKVPPWLPPLVRTVMPCRTLHLVRDPRDVFLSVSAFNRARGRQDFGRGPNDSDLDYARVLAHGLLSYFENQRAEHDRDDCLTVRYEDLIADTPGSVARLNQFLGLNLTCEAVGGDYMPKHQTSAGLDASIGRWKREALPPGVGALLEAHLHEMLAFNGYECSTAPAAALDLSRVASVGGDGTLTPTADGGWSVTVTGDDFWVELAPAEFPAAVVREVWVCLRADTGEHCSLYWRGPHETLAEARAIHLRCRPGGHWHIVRFRVGEHPQWNGTIGQLRFDLFNETATPGRGGAVRWVRLVE